MLAPGAHVVAVRSVPGDALGEPGMPLRAAGTQAQLMVKDGGYAQLKMASGEIRRVPDGDPGLLRSPTMAPGTRRFTPSG